jgi:hypothetical protein
MLEEELVDPQPATTPVAEVFFFLKEYLDQCSGIKIALMTQVHIADLFSTLVGRQTALCFPLIRRSLITAMSWKGFR